MARDPLSQFREPVRAWFRSALGEPTRAQALGWPPIARGESTLLLSPTGSGKTLAAFLAVLDTLTGSPEPPKEQRCKVLYVSPLKALAVDVERNLRAPIAGITATAMNLGVASRVPTIGVRSGDTPAQERTRMRRTPPDILITTPESLYLLLTSGAREMLPFIDTVIIDEIHSLVPSKRGAHLFVTLERLEELRTKARPDAPKLQRIGLSATQRPLDEVAALLGGFENGTKRPVTIIDAQQKKPLRLVVAVPDPEFARAGELEAIPSGSAAGAPARKSVWPKMHEDLVRRIREQRTTMIFVNSRRLAERLAAALNELAGEELALAHHGSVAREKRTEIEDRLKRGLLPAIVATSSLELGIDMGTVDLVVQIESPPSVASGLQRIGRASHQVGGVPNGVILPKHKGDLAACATVTSRMRDGLVEETFYPRNPLDILAQQVVAVASDGELQVDALFDIMRRAAPFADLSRTAFDGVLDMLTGLYPSDEFAELRPRLSWDRVTGKLRAREGAKRLAIINGGTIPDRGLYGVFLADGEGGSKGSGGGGDASAKSRQNRGGKRVGELDEEMVFELREGEVFLLGATAWRAAEITHDRVLVTPAAGEPGKMPFWHGDRPGRPRDFGAAIGAVVRKIAATKSDAEAEQLLVKDHDLDAEAAKNLAAYVREQREITGDVPSDKTIVIERFVDEIGDYRVCVLTPFGMRVHAPWGTAILSRLRETSPGDIEGVWSDDGMVFRIPASEQPPAPELFLPPSDDVEAVVTESLGGTALFAARFRENAARALLLPRRGPGRRTPLWAQRKRSADLLAVASRHASFPILLETYRECLRDVFDLPGLVDILRKVEQRRIRVRTVDTRVPSPFASTVLFSFVGNFIYDGDAPVAERRMAALVLDHAQLRELLGETELRQLLDAEVIDEHERGLQRLVYPVKHPDGVHDLLLLVGDLSIDELRLRCDPQSAAETWIAELVAARRVIELRIGRATSSGRSAGERPVRYAAAEDVGRFRDALGIMPPRGMPAAFLEPVADPLGDLVRRYARTHGPFRVDDLVNRFDVPTASVEPVIARLTRAGTFVEGAFRPGGHGSELCDAEVLKALRRRSLAELRREVEPVDPEAFARFLPHWQGVARKARGADALLAVIGQLEGCPLPYSALEEEIFPARLEIYAKWDLDELCASGEIVWAGVEPIGPSDGRVALYLTEHEPLLTAPPREAPGAIAATIRELMLRRGAVFFAEIARAVGGYPKDTLDALWDMVWAGEVTNDTLEPLRSLRRVQRAHARGRGRDLRNGGRAVRGGPPGSEGRWSLRAARWSDAARTPTTRAAALARALLDRYGIVTREVAQSEGLEGGFSAIYPVLKAMEEAGKIRRGYFIAGRGGAQFALPGADERLRGLRDRDEEPETRVLSAVDPANPYGASLPWPERVATTLVARSSYTAPAAPDAGDETSGARPQRVAGARVILFGGALLAYVARGDETITTFLPKDEPAATQAMRAVSLAIAGLLDGKKRRALLVRSIDGAPPRAHVLGPHLVALGFQSGAAGYLLRLRGDANANANANANTSDAADEPEALDTPEA